MAQPKDYYQVLGVDETADAAALKKAYRRLARTYHPDRNKESGAADRFKEVNEAHQILSDPEKRTQYDTIRKYGGLGGGFPGHGGSGGGGGVDLGDLFGSMFGGGGGTHGGASRQGGGWGGTQPAPATRGDNIRSTVEVPFETAIHGGTMEVRYRPRVNCDRCKGEGAEPGTRPRTCPTCEGRGVVNLDQGPFAFSRPCPACGGSGAVIESPCRQCAGRGTAMQQRTVDVKIPAGVHDGQKIRLAKLGHEPGGSVRGRAGDLILEVRVAAHERFRRDGRNLHLDVAISMVDAALGTKIDVPTVDGTITLRIPPGTQPGGTLRIRAKGVAYKGGRGDQLVHVAVRVPKDLTPDQRRMLEELRGLATPAPAGHGAKAAPS